MSISFSRLATRATAFLLSSGALIVTAIAPAALAAQVVVVDDGTFSLFRAGERIGREDFSIRATRGALGSAFVAQGNVLTGERRTSVALSADSAGGPVRFQLEAREGTTVVESYAGERQRGIWSGRSVHANGESAREIRLQNALIVVEPGIVHQLWFVVRFGEGRSVTLFLPRTLGQRGVSVQELAPDRVVLGVRELVARHWEIRPVEGGEVIWELWTDAQGRLLRVRVAADGIEAIRDEPPR
jgi:hypothetical protein